MRGIGAGLSAPPGTWREAPGLGMSELLGRTWVAVEELSWERHEEEPKSVSEILTWAAVWTAEVFPWIATELLRYPSHMQMAACMHLQRGLETRAGLAFWKVSPPICFVSEMSPKGSYVDSLVSTWWSFGR